MEYVDEELRCLSESVLFSADHLADKERFLFNKDLGVNPLKIAGNKLIYHHTYSVLVSQNAIQDCSPYR